MDKNIKVKEDINLHIINTEKFKTNMVSIFLTKKLDKNNITQEALIPAVLRLGTAELKTQRELSKKLEDMYGADFNCGIEKRGNNHVIKFYIETINDEYTLEKGNLLNASIALLLDIVFNPLVENNSFKAEYIDSEKENLKRIIESKIDNKSIYAYIRCIEEMYKNEDYGLYEYGYIEDLEKVDGENLYKYYKSLVENSKIDIYISGKITNENDIVDVIKNNKNIQKLNNRTAEYIQDSTENPDNIEIKEIIEKMDITQGKIVIGLSVINSENEDAILNVYNAILGGGASSKLFQNVREKSSLAYSAGSVYLKSKNNIFIKCGIEIENYDKTIEIIKQQLEDIKKGDFSNEDMKSAKELIIASLDSIPDEQANEISYEFSQELSKRKIKIDEFINNIKLVTKDQIKDVAERIKINTIYFLRN